MAVYRLVELHDGAHARKEAARLAALLTGGRGVMTEDEARAQGFGGGEKGDTRLTPWQRERFPRMIAEYGNEIEAGKFNPATDTLIEGATNWRGGQYVVRLLPETVGRTLSVEVKYSYIGDGDGYYYGQAVIVNDDGTTAAVACGGAYIRNGRTVDTRDGADLYGSAVDVADELVTAKLAEDVAREKRQAIATFNDTAATVEHGKLVRVVKGRKLPIGLTGRVGWMGDNGWGMSVGIDTDEGRKFTSINNVDVICEPFED